jgi:hypothetical protein
MFYVQVVLGKGKIRYSSLISSNLIIENGGQGGREGARGMLSISYYHYILYNERERERKRG